jgi:ribose-phosphate pyrophosphokinase
MKVISGSSNKPLAAKMADLMGLHLVDVELSQFANGEKRVWIKEPVKGSNIILIQSFSSPTNDHIMEFLLLVDALERMGARHVNLVMPWMGYSLQDKVFREGEPIAAKVIADLVCNSYVKRVFLLELHNSSTPGFFSIPTQHLTALQLFADYAKKTFDLSQAVVASPDFGGLKKARQLAEKLDLDLINIDKHRNLRTGEVTAMGLSGDAEGKTVLIFDDVINSGSTVVSAAEVLKKHGAKEVHFMATHGPLVPSAFEKIENSEVDTVVVTNSMLHDESTKKVKTIDIAPLFATELETWRRPKLTDNV